MIFSRASQPSLWTYSGTALNSTVKMQWSSWFQIKSYIPIYNLKLKSSNSPNIQYMTNWSIVLLHHKLHSVMSLCHMICFYMYALHSHFNIKLAFAWLKISRTYVALSKYIFFFVVCYFRHIMSLTKQYLHIFHTSAHNLMWLVKRNGSINFNIRK